jgi:hypothetical protein
LRAILQRKHVLLISKMTDSNRRLTLSSVLSVNEKCMPMRNRGKYDDGLS